VIIEHARAYQSALPPADQFVMEGILDSWSAFRAARRFDLLVFLDSPEYDEFAAGMWEFCQTPKRGARTFPAEMPVPVKVAHVVAGLIFDRYQVVRAYDPVIEEAPIATLHMLRIETKRLRYVLEFFEGLLDSQAKEVIKRAVLVQDHLGALHDADVACALIGAYQQARTVEDAGAAAYLASRQADRDRLAATFGEVWGGLIAPETRRLLARAVERL
jgi:CHAD domain-containing protein